MWGFEKHLFLTVIDNISKNYIIFVKYRKLSTPSFVGPSLRICIQNESIFQNPAKRPILHLWALHSVFVSKMNQFFKMPQSVRPFICGSFILYFSLKWINFQNAANRPTLHLWALHCVYFSKMNQLFKMSQTFHPFIRGRFIVYLSVKWIDFFKCHKPSTPSFVGAPSRNFL